MKKTFWKIVAVAMAVLLSPMAASAGSVYQECSPCSGACNPCDPVCGKAGSLWEYGGWLDGGIYGNEYGQENAYVNGRLTDWSGNTEVLQNVHQSDFQLNQGWVYFGKKLSKRGWDVGGRVDLGFGTDMRFLQSANLEYNYEKGNDRWGTGDYYWAIPQLYAEVGYNNVSLKVGKFISAFGYESIMSPERFFYSMCYAYAIRPATQTGAIATWDVNRRFSVFGGWTNGYDQFFENEDDNAFLGGFTWKATDRVKVGYTLMIGQQQNWFVGRNRDYFINSFFVDTKLTKRFNYVFEWTMHNEDYHSDFNRYAGAYGINNELFYHINKKWSLGARLEWMHFYGNYGGWTDLAAPSDDAVGFTLGANWKPTNYFTLRPEVRYDVLDNSAIFNGYESKGTDWKENQWSFGVSGVLHF